MNLKKILSQQAKLQKLQIVEKRCKSCKIFIKIDEVRNSGRCYLKESYYIKPMRRACKFYEKK